MIAGVFVRDKVLVNRMRSIAFALLTPFYFLKAGLYVSLPAVAAGADGLLLEVHPSPDDALSDGPQSLTFEQFGVLMDDVRRLVTALRHELVGVPSQDPR